MDLEALILIGGRSSRLGMDKAFVALDGETLTRRASNTIEAGLTPSRITLVASAKDQFSARDLADLGLPTISDLKPGFGAWSGIHAGLAYARAEWALVLACDLPFVSREFLRLLVGAAGDEFKAIAPRQPDGRLQPLCALYRVKPSLNAAEAIFAGSHRLPQLSIILERLEARIVEPEEYTHLPSADRLFVNINTPDDLAAASLE